MSSRSLSEAGSAQRRVSELEEMTVGTSTLKSTQVKMEQNSQGLRGSHTRCKVWEGGLQGKGA